MESSHTKQQLRSFGLTVGGIFLVIGTWPVIRHGQHPRWWSVVLAGALLLPGLFSPGILNRPYQLWMGLAHVLGWINSRIILTVMFYVAFTPVAFIMGLFGADPLNRRFLSDAKTYRVLSRQRSASHLKHQF